jgi:hypothetical protein
MSPEPLGAIPSRRTGQTSPKLPCPATPQTSHTDQRRGPDGGLLPAAHGSHPPIARAARRASARHAVLGQRGVHGGAGLVHLAAE